MLGATIWDSPVYKTAQYTNPASARGWFNVRFAAFVIAIILAVLAYNSFSGFLGETFGSWFGWKSRGELIEENKNQGKVINQVIETNHGLVEGEKKADDARVAVDTIGINVNREVKKVDKKTQASVTKLDTTAKEVEKKPELTESQKDREVAEAVIATMWEGYCSIDPSADPQCAKVLDTPTLKPSLKLAQGDDLNPISI